LTTSVSGIVVLGVREFASDIVVNKLKYGGYKLLALLIPGPCLSAVGGLAYTASKWSRVRAVASTVYNLGG
jgi:hypothetical protein